MLGAHLTWLGWFKCIGWREMLQSILALILHTSLMHTYRTHTTCRQTQHESKMGFDSSVPWTQANTIPVGRLGSSRIHSQLMLFFSFYDFPFFRRRLYWLFFLRAYPQYYFVQASEIMLRYLTWIIWQDRLPEAKLILQMCCLFRQHCFHSSHVGVIYYISPTAGKPSLKIAIYPDYFLTDICFQTSCVSDVFLLIRIA